VGEPAPLTSAEKRYLVTFVDSIVDAVANDLDQPVPKWPDGDAMDEGTMIFKLCQLAQELQVGWDDMNQRLIKAENALAAFRASTVPR